MNEDAGVSGPLNVAAQDAEKNVGHLNSSSVLKDQVRAARAEFVENMENHSEIFGCYLILNRDGVIQYLNLQGLDILGVDCLLQQGWRLAPFVLESDRDLFEKFILRIFTNVAKEHCEVILQASANRRIWVRLDGKVSLDGNLCHIVLFDISERKRMESSLAASEGKYRAMFSNMSTAFSYHKFIRDKHGKGFEAILLEANDAYGTMLGIPVSKMIGLNCSEINATGCAPTLDWDQLCHDVVIRMQPACFDYYDKTLKRWLSVIAYSPAPEHMALVYVDITKTKSVEQEVSESEQRYRGLIQGTDVVIMIINKRAEISFINEYGLSFFGFREEELISRSIFETIVPNSDSSGKNAAESLDEFKAKPGYQRRNIKENITRSGQRVWVDWTNHEMLDPKNGEQIIICVGVDVTESKRTELESLSRHKQQRQKNLLNDAIHKQLAFPEWLPLARQIGIDLQPPLILSLLEIPSNYLSSGMSEQVRTDCQHLVDSVIETIQHLGVGVTWQTPDGIGILRSLPDKFAGAPSEQAQVIAADIVKIVSRCWNGMDMRLGVSRPSSQTQNIGEMYAQAQSAITYGPVLHPERTVHFWHDLGCYQFVLNDLGSEQAQHFVRENLGPLLEINGSEDHGELLVTLKELLTGDSAQVIAKKLHIHPQTVAFRKKKIEKCLNVDLDSMETRLKLTIATRLLSFMEKNVRMAHLVV